MARFIVPKFIEHEPKVVGPLSFKQFVFIGAAGAIVFILYFMLPFYLFLITALVLIIGAMGLAFVKVGPYSMPTLLKNFFTYSASSRLYIWKKKAIPPKIMKKPEPKEVEEAEKGPALKIAEKSQLKKLSTQIETGTK